MPRKFDKKLNKDDAIYKRIQKFKEQMKTFSQFESSLRSQIITSKEKIERIKIWKNFSEQIFTSKIMIDLI